MIELKVSDDVLNRAEKMLESFRDESAGIASRAINRSIRSGRTAAVREVRKEYAINAGDVTRRMYVQNAKVSNILGVIGARGRSLSLDKFKLSPKTVDGRRRSPLSVSIFKGKREKVYGFIAPARRSGNLTAFRRKDKSRYPVEMLFGPSVPQMLDHEKVVEAVQDTAVKTFEKRLDHEINRIIKKDLK